MRNYRAKNVDAYIAGSAQEARPHLKELRKIIRSTIPNVEEKISWGVPFYRYYGLLAGFSVFTHHVSFGFTTALHRADRAMFAKKGYTTGKKTVQIRFDQKVPAAAIVHMLKAQAKTNKAKKAAQ